MGKQGELMELMAKAERDRLKKELEDKLRESGDLPPKQEEAIKVLLCHCCAPPRAAREFCN